MVRKTCIKLISFVDLFGSPFFINIKNDSSEHKTTLGGIYTILMLLSSFVFGLARIIEWK